MVELRRSAWIGALGVFAGCFSEGSGQGPVTATTEDPTTTTGVSGSTAATSLTDTADTTASAEAGPGSSGEASSSGPVPGCANNVADPPELCVQPSWAFGLPAGATAIRRAQLDGGADDLVITTAGIEPALMWVLGGPEPTVDGIDVLDAHPPVVADADRDGVDEVLTLGDSELASDLIAYRWMDGEFSFVSQRDPPAGERFVAATMMPFGDGAGIAWLVDADRIDAAPLTNVGNPIAVTTIQGKAIGLATGRHGTTDFLIHCTQQSAITYPLEADATPLAESDVGDATPTACVAGALFDGGETDLVVLDGDGVALVVLLAGATPGRFVISGNVGLNAEPLDVDMGDLDGDGDRDLVVRQLGQHYLRVIWIDDDGVPTPGPRLMLPDAPDSLAVGDFDGDGDADIAYTIGAELQLLAVGDD